MLTVDGKEETIVLDGNTGDITLKKGDITLNEGDITLMNADCAEDFEISAEEHVEAGTVMALNDAGELEQSTMPYDKRVAGVVSGAGDLKPD